MGVKITFVESEDRIGESGVAVVDAAIVATKNVSTSDSYLFRWDSSSETAQNTYARS